MLSASLEHCLLNAAMNGHLDLKRIKKEELSRTGQFVLAGLVRLAKKGSPPFKPKVVFVAATDVAGGDPDVIRPFLSKVLDAAAGEEAQTLLKAIHDRRLLVDLVNLATDQLSSGEFQPQSFMELLGKSETRTLLESSSEDFKEGKVHTLPEGVPLPFLPKINTATHGLGGMWALSGNAGSGKSTLALELAVMVQKHRPVLYYDLENGKAVQHARLYQAFNGNSKQLMAATKQLYFRELPGTLEADLSLIRKPCLIILDSIQKVPVRGDDKRTGLDAWVHKLELLKQHGHSVLLLSEKSRAFYDKVGQAGYKETGEIEYAVDVGAELLPVKDSDNVVEFHLNKNRHYGKTGYITTLIRKNNWWFQEAGSK